MRDYLNRQEVHLETGQGIDVNVMNQTPSMHLNTGTALNSYLADRDNFHMGGMGDYNMIGWANPPEPTTSVSCSMWV